MSPQRNDVEVATLASGLRIAIRRIPRAAVEYCGIVVRAGSRDDGPAPGLAHFVEHTIFKGTQRRSAWHIINRMERVGGELNAYTTKEETVVYTAAPTGNLLRSMDLLADLATASQFPEHQIDKERGVVCDEINSYLDTPSEAVFDDFEDLIFAGTPIGHNILGSVESVNAITSVQCRDYLRRWYVTSNLVVYYVGSASTDRVVKAVERCFGAMCRGEAVHLTIPEGFAPQIFDDTKELDLHQTHTVMGATIPGMFSPQRHAMSLLTNILGGPGMNSLLNVALREKRGLVYSVDTATAYYTDCGLFTVYFGCDPEDTQRCQTLIKGIIADIAEHGLSATALAQAKKQYLGQLAVASDNRESLAISIGRAVLYYGNTLTSNELHQKIQAITNDEIRASASLIANISSLSLR